MVAIKCPGCKQTFSSQAGLSTHKQYCKCKITAFSKKILKHWEVQFEGEPSQKCLRFEKIVQDDTPEIEEEEESWLAQECEELDYGYDNLIGDDDNNDMG